MFRPRRHSTSAATEVSRVNVFPSGLGWVATAWQHKRLYALTFGHRSPQLAVTGLGLSAEASASVEAASGDAFAERLQAYADGRADDFRDVPVVLDDFTDFQRRVFHRCRRIAYGSTLAYGELAAAIGAPQAARAVGNTMARNRIPLVIPCHRVVGAAGALGGFSAPDGINLKRRLLQLEKENRR